LSLGFGSAYLRFYSKYKATNNNVAIAKLNGLFIIAFSFFSIVALLASGVLYANINLVFGSGLTAEQYPIARLLVLILSLNIVLSFLVSVFNSYVISHERFIFAQLVFLGKSILTPLVSVFILALGLRLVGLAICTIIISFIIDLITVLFCINVLKMKFIFGKPDFKLLREILVFSSYIALNTIVDAINMNTDKLLITRFHGTSQSAIYDIASQINRLIITLSSAISNVFAPRINRIVSTSNNNIELCSIFIKVGRVQFIILSLICSGFVFFGRSFIYFWVGPFYNNAYFIALLLIISIITPLIQNIGITIQQARNKHKFRSIVYFFMAIINLLISIPLSRSYSGIGAAVGTAISLILANGIAMNLYYNHIGINVKAFWMQIIRLLPSLILPCMLGTFYMFMFNYIQILPFILFGVLYILIFAISMWFFGLNKYEKSLISSVVKKIAKPFVLLKRGK
jgi:O-antigen/teichoic acid export membrane protein